MQVTGTILCDIVKLFSYLSYLNLQSKFKIKKDIVNRNNNGSLVTNDNYTRFTSFQA